MIDLSQYGCGDVASFSAAFECLGDAGGTISIPHGFPCHIETDLTVPKGVGILGPYIHTGPRRFDDAIGTMAAITIAPTAKIILEDAAGLAGCILKREGLTLPAMGPDDFAGLAVQISGSDAFVHGCMILGFDKAVKAHGFFRPRIRDVLIDCKNGIEVSACYDVGYIENVHCWPICTTYLRGAESPSNDQRPGKAFYFHDVADWCKVTNCFAYGYLEGFRLTNVNSCTLLSCGADNTKSGLTGGTPNHVGSKGFVIDGTSTECRLIGWQAAAMDYAGIHIHTAPGAVTHIHSGNAWLVNNHAIVVSHGDANIVGNSLRNAYSGIAVNNAASRVMRNANRFKSCNTPLNVVAGTMLGGHDDVS